MWLALTLFTFVTFLASILALTRRGFAPDGSFRRAGVVFIVGATLSALIWAFSLSKVPPPHSLKNLKRYEVPRFEVPQLKP